MTITIERNQKIQSLQIIYIYISMCVCVCVCDYTNSDVKTSKMPKKIYN